MPLLDTSYVLDVLAGEGDAVTILDFLQQGSAPLGTSAYTHFELYAGIGRSQRPDEEKQRVEAFLDALVVFELTPAAARMAGLVDARLAADGRPLALVDLLIGCTAVHHGQPVVTNNPEHFERIPGLEVLSY